MCGERTVVARSANNRQCIEESFQEEIEWSETALSEIGGNGQLSYCVLLIEKLLFVAKINISSKNDAFVEKSERNGWIWHKHQNDTNP